VGHHDTRIAITVNVAGEEYQWGMRRVVDGYIFVYKYYLHSLRAVLPARAWAKLVAKKIFGCVSDEEKKCH
jgi:hypothetical protein